MRTRILYCEVCGKQTPHQVDGSDADEGELALCTLCGRLSSVPPDPISKTPPGADCPRCRH